MQKDDISENVRISNGSQFTFPESNMNLLGFSDVDYISFVEKYDQIFVENPAVYAMKTLHDNMTDIHMNNNEVIELIKEFRNQ